MTEAVASGECLVTSGEAQRAVKPHAGSLRIVEVESKPFAWELLPREHCGMVEQRESRWFAYLLMVGFWMFLMVTWGLIYLGATVVGQSVRHAWEQGLSVHSVHAEVARRLD